MKLKKNLDNELNFVYNLKNKGIKVTPPRKMISKRDPVRLRGNSDVAILEVVENAHSSTDILMTIEKQKVCFIGDLLFSNCYPWIGSGDPKRWNDFMQILVEKDIEYFIPGHGPIATKKEVYQQIKYIKEILKLSKKYFEEKRDITEINPSDLSKEFEDWDDMVFRWNNKFLSEYYKR